MKFVYIVEGINLDPFSIYEIRVLVTILAAILTFVKYKCWEVFH